ncbi:MAG: class I SAM-dependent methyltransferase [Planctomycetota bacterium]
MTTVPDTGRIARPWPPNPAGEAEEFVRLVCDPVWTRHRLLQSAWTLVEVGCGRGDRARAFAGRFGLVLGFDPEAATVDEARRRNADVPNARFAVAPSEALEVVPADGIDFCFSSLDGARVGAALREISRILKPGGHAQFRFEEASFAAVAWIRLLSRWRAAARGGVSAPGAVAAQAMAGIERAVASARLDAIEVTRRRSGELWVLARKPLGR